MLIARSPFTSSVFRPLVEIHLPQGEGYSYSPSRKALPFALFTLRSALFVPRSALSTLHSRPAHLSALQFLIPNSSFLIAPLRRAPLFL